MARIEDSALGNYNNDGSQSDSEGSDDLFPIAAKNEERKRRHRKRSSSLPFVETNHAGLWKGLVASKEMQCVKSKESHSRNKARKGKDWKDFSSNETAVLNQSSLGEHRPARRSSSMPEFYSNSECKKDELVRHHKTKRSGSKRHKKLAGTSASDLEMKEDQEILKLPVISNESVSSKREPQDQNGNEIEALSQSIESMKIQRKTYLPRINNSNNGGVFMKSR